MEYNYDFKYRKTGVKRLYHIRILEKYSKRLLNNICRLANSTIWTYRIHCLIYFVK